MGGAVLALAIGLHVCLLLCYVESKLMQSSNTVAYGYSRATQLCGCRFRQVGCPQSATNAGNGTFGRICTAEPVAFSVTLTVQALQGENGDTMMPVDGATVRAWQSNQHGTFRTVDGCSSLLATDENGQVQFEASRPGRGLLGWTARTLFEEEEGATHVIVQHAPYTTVKGLVYYSNDSAEQASGALSCEYDMPAAEGALTELACTVTLVTEQNTTMAQRRDMANVDSFVSYVQQQQAPFRNKKMAKGCPKIRYIMSKKYYQTATGAFIVQICNSTDPYNHANCKASPLPEYAEKRQDLYAARIIHVLKQPTYCDPDQKSCPLKNMLWIDGETPNGRDKDAVILVDVATVVRCCEHPRSGMQLFALGIALPSPLFSSQRTGPGSSSRIMPQLSVTQMYSATRIMSRLIRDRLRGLR